MNVYGAPSTGIPLSTREDSIIRGGESYSAALMSELLRELTPDELLLRADERSASDYDYKAFRSESNIFASGHSVHILRHLRYDLHEPHQHDYFEIFCQVFGTGVAEISGEKLVLTAGTVCLLSPGTTHRLEARSDASVILKIILRESDFEEYSRRLLRSDSLLTGFFRASLHGGSGFLMFETGDDSEIRELLLRMRYHEVRRALTDPLMKESLLLQLFCRLVSDYIGNAHAGFTDGVEGRILMRIGEEFRSVTLGKLAEEFHFTRDYISRLVRKLTGQSFSELVASLRVEHACRLLEDHSIPIAFIAVDSGFGCREFFNKKFREVKGISPSDYRKKH